MKDRAHSRLEPVALLADPVRRRIYLFTRGSDHAVSREEVATALGISPKLAAFHLEKLLANGLLRSHYARPAGRSGPGAGRSAKHYGPSDVQIDVSIPERRYDLAGSLMAEAITSERPDERAKDTALRVAKKEGMRAGEEWRAAQSRRRPRADRTLADVAQILSEYGFEPYRDEPHGLALRNCPFHALAAQSPDVVCEMNRSFIAGILRGLGSKEVKAVLACKPGDCCVTIRSPKATLTDASGTIRM